MQERRPLAFMSQSLRKRHQGLSTFEKEIISLLLAVDKWRHYLHLHHFIITTGHFSLKFLQEQKTTTSLPHKGLTKLMGLSYGIQYRKGVENLVADALSRKHEQATINNQSQYLMLTQLQSKWLEEVLSSSEGDQEVVQAIATLRINPSANLDVTLQQGLPRYKGKVWVGNHGSLKQQLLSTIHHSRLGGHSGTMKTYHRVNAIFYWPSMAEDVKKTVQECETCQRCKEEQMAYPGLLQPLPAPKRAWERISMDFIEGLPKSEGYDAIFVVL